MHTAISSFNLFCTDLVSLSSSVSWALLCLSRLFLLLISIAISPYVHFGTDLMHYSFQFLYVNETYERFTMVELTGEGRACIPVGLTKT